jgi:hypothetical protein
MTRGFSCECVVTLLPGRQGIVNTEPSQGKKKVGWGNPGETLCLVATLLPPLLASNPRQRARRIASDDEKSAGEAVVAELRTHNFLAHLTSPSLLSFPVFRQPVSPDIMGMLAREVHTAIPPCVESSSQAATERQNDHGHKRANERNRYTSKPENIGPHSDVSRCNGYAHDCQANGDQRDE